MSAVAMCPATIQTAPTGAVECVDGGGAAVAWTVQPEFDPSQIDSTAAGAAFGAGFTIIGVAWFLGKSAELVLNAIKRS